MSEELPKRLDPKAIEGPLYAAWEAAGYFHVPASAVDRSAGESPYVIVIPPPNVTAVLHMGHGLNNTIQDVLIRWQRMTGRPTLWVPGTDHAGIATQNVVERQLKSEGLTRDDLGREAFVERVWTFVRDTEQRILGQLRAIGSSCDWTRTRFTLDEGLSRAVRTVFVELFERGLIYRGEYIINWCPRCLTALSNEEAEGEEVEGALYHLRYPLAAEAAESARLAAEAGAAAIVRLDDGRWALTVSTTRPETMLGDTAVAVHSGDERYRALVGAQVELPLTGRTIPIVADSAVDPEFGTGMVKVTPAHDLSDFEIAQRTGAELLNVMTPDAHLNELVPAAFQGLDRFEARTAVIEAFKAQGLFAGSEVHRHSVPHCYRCHTVVEPRLSEQWFVRMKPLAEPALQASRDGTVTFTPEHWQRVYEHWMENIRDWCISRQLWWGHRIPAWYCDDCDGTTVSVETPDACRHCGGARLSQDADVLDTWFSSWLWPFSTLGWPDDTEDLRAFYPGSTLVTGPDILFFWVARMIMAGYAFLGETPFRSVYLNGIVRDRQGRKLSKSLGNGIDPLEVVDLFGADALRFTLINSAAVGTDIYLDHEDLEASFAPGRNFANKVWNAGRFALMNLGEDPVRPVEDVAADLEGADRWILSRLQGAAAGITREMERYRLKEVADQAYHFFWGDLADWYLELVKPRLRADADPANREAARATLVHVLDGALRLLHPLVPFVTEALWARLPRPQGRPTPPALIVAPWPAPEEAWADEDAEQRFGELQELVVTVRSLRKEYGVPEGQPVPVRVAGERAAAMVDGAHREGAALARLGGIAELSEAPGAGVGASAVLHNGVEVFVPLEGLIDLDRERERLQAEIERLRAQHRQTAAKLDNASFVERAPAEVVAREREKAARFHDQAETLELKLRALTTS
ncbi:MAG: valine--tRNA ligase [Gemmatimonadota bacterium]